MGILRSIIAHPVLVLGTALAVTLGSFFSISRLEVDNSVEIWLLENDPALRAYEEFRNEFQNDEYLVIGYEPPGGALSDDSLAMTARLTGALERIDGVLKVTSITSVEEIRALGDVLQVGKLVTPPVAAADRDRILYKLATDPLYAGSLTSRDGSAAAIIVNVQRIPHGNIEMRYRILDEVNHALENEGGTPFYVTGGVAFDIELFRSMIHDLKRSIPMMGLVFLVALGVLFRTAAGVLVPTGTVVVSVIWTFGLLALSGYDANVCSAILPVVLLAIGVADSVHLLSEYEEELAHGRERREALERAVSTVFVPCLFTSVTTAAGFLGLLLIRVAPLREFGAFAAAGTMLAFIATFTIMPAALALLPAPAHRLDAVQSHRRSARWSGRMFDFVAQHRNLTVACSFVLLAFGVAGLPRVHTSANWYHYLEKDNPTIVATDFVEGRIGGVYTVEVLLTPRDERSGDEAIKSVNALREMDAMQRQLEADPAVEKTISPVDFVKAMNRELHGGNPAFFDVPDSRNAIGQFLLMYELDAPDGELYDFVNFDFSRGRITARAKMSKAESHRPLIRKVRQHAPTLRELKAVPTGLMVLYNNMEYYMLHGMITGFSVAFVAVAIMMILLLRTLHHGLLAMIPAVLPIVFVIGMTGWFGLALGTMPAMMGNIALGITVDNAIHMLTRYRRLRATGIRSREAIGQAVTIVGRPVLFTTVVLCFGFAILGTSDLQPNKLFGVLTATILVGSLLGSLVTLPATVLVAESWIRVRTRARLGVEASAEARDG